MSDFSKLSAYELIKTEDLKDIASTGYLFKHKKSGARLAVISNSDDNKVFSIAFRTTPTDETGVPHIIEHTTLCGSTKYPLKDPFVDLVKGSLNTFLNAITYPDKTIYPIASYNDQDFKNLMDVYLDAVFNPNLLKEQKIFKQEGWHYEMEDEASDLTITGVVYNEMKGAYSSEDEILATAISKSLFPDNTYSKDSGGNPDRIPELTYEKYVEFYHTYYHPSNSYIYLYGDMDVEERLNYLDREYLSKYEAKEMHTEITPQKPFDKRIRVEGEYPVASDDPTDKATYLSCNWVTGDALDALNYLAVDILDYALISAPGAPVMQALLDAGIGDDVYSDYHNGTRQNFFSIVAKGAEPEDEARFVKIIEDTLQKQVKEGINRNSLLAAINSNEFRYREADYGRFPKGLMYGIQMMDSWLFDDNAPYMHIECLDNYAYLKKQIDTGYFEKLIEELFLNNTHSSLVILKPNPGMNVRAEEAQKQNLKKLRDSLTEEEIAKIVRETAELHAYQEAPNDPKDAECLPMLKRSDLRKTSLPISNIEETVDGVTYLRHDVETNGIDYVNLRFDVDDIDPDRLPALGLLADVLGYIDTKAHSYLELSNAVNIYTGGISNTITMFPVYNDPDCLNTRFTIRLKVLEENLGKALDLIDEMLFDSKWSDSKRIGEIVSQIKSRMQTELSATGNTTAAVRSCAGFSKQFAYRDRLSNIEFYNYICRVDELLKKDPSAVCRELENLCETFLTRKRLLVEMTANSAVYDRAKALIRDHVAKLPADGEHFAEKKLNLTRQKEGLTDASQIDYVVRSGNFLTHGFTYSGYLRILKLILSYDYLWTNVRVKGGAYGCAGQFFRTGESYFSSYRDPNLAKTNQIYEGIPDYLRSFDADEREMTGYVIGTFGAMDTPMNPEAKGLRSLNAYYTKVTYEMLQEERTQILNATVEDIRGLAPLVEAVLSDDQLCVVGNENAIKAEKALFDRVTKLCE